MNIKNLWYTKSEIIFLCHTKMKFYFFDTWLYFCCYVTTKIYHHGIILNNVRNKSSVLLEKQFFVEFCVFFLFVCFIFFLLVLAFFYYNLRGECHEILWILYYFNRSRWAVHFWKLYWNKIFSREGLIGSKKMAWFVLLSD